MCRSLSASRFSSPCCYIAHIAIRTHNSVCGFRSASKSKPYSAGQYGRMETAASVGGWTASFLISIYVHVRRINGAITRSGGTYWPRTFYSTLVVLQSSFFCCFRFGQTLRTFKTHIVQPATRENTNKMCDGTSGRWYGSVRV